MKGDHRPYDCGYFLECVGNGAFAHAVSPIFGVCFLLKGITGLPG